jgi:hypothetical protein
MHLKIAKRSRTDFDERNCCTLFYVLPSEKATHEIDRKLAAHIGYLYLK